MVTTLLDGAKHSQVETSSCHLLHIFFDSFYVYAKFIIDNFINKLFKLKVF